MNTLQRQSAREAGFTLVEAMVAMLVMAFGMLAIAGFQTTMSRNSDVAKQRTEAVRLGQREIERLRAFETVVSDVNRFDYVDDVVNGNRTLSPTDGAYTTNTTYTVTWALTRDGSAAAVGTDLQKWIRVDVAWSDRTGQAQSVTLRSVIARNDPVDLGTIFNNPGGTRTRLPKNRHIDIPYPAVDIGGGKSGFTPPGNPGYFYVFDNTTGNIEKVCSGTPTLGFDLTGCTNKFAYLLSGFIRFKTSGTVNPAALVDPRDDLKDVVITVKYVSPSLALNAPDCFDEPVSPDSLGSKYIRYACVIEPGDHDSDGNGPSATPYQWSGQFVITPTGSGWGSGLGTTGAHFKLCRYSGDYVSNNVVSNSEHPLYYRGVTGGLDHQNYVVIQGDKSCPGDVEIDPLNGDYINTNTFVHQTTAPPSALNDNTGQPWGGDLSNHSQWGGGAETGSETSFPML